MDQKQFVTLLIFLAVVVAGTMVVVLSTQKADTQPKVIFDEENSRGNFSSQGELHKEEEDTQDTTTPEVITSKTDTSDWLTYRDEEYGFEFKYPDEGIKIKTHHGGEPIQDPCGHAKCIALDDIMAYRFGIAINPIHDRFYFNRVLKNIEEYNWKKTWFVTKNDLVFLYPFSSKHNCGNVLFDKQDINVVIRWNCSNPANPKVDYNEIMKALMSTWKFYD